MRVGFIAPQGWTGEYDGWDASRAWARTVAVAHEVETLGFDSIWLFDHLQTEPVPTDEITFEASSPSPRSRSRRCGSGWATSSCARATATQPSSPR